MVPVGQAVLSEAADRQQLGRLMGTVGFAVALGPAVAEHGIERRQAITLHGEKAPVDVKEVSEAS